jgi:uncharacterized protein involved in exopolysaccharide biosynthesis
MVQEQSLEQRWIGPTPCLTARDVVAVLFRRRGIFIVCFAVVFFSALLYAFLLPSYESQMKILVRRGRLDPPITPQATRTSEYSRYDVTEEEFNSEIELLKDQDILRQVVLAQHLERKEKSWWSKNEEVGIARATRRLASRLSVEPLRKTRLMVVRYRSSDPAQAAQVLHSLADYYATKHLEVHRPSGEFRFFEQQFEQYRKDLEAAESDLLQMMDGTGVVSAAQERDAALQKLSEAESHYQEIPVALHETQRRIQALTSILNREPERTTTEIRTSDNAQLMEKMKSALLNLNLKRTELLTKFQPNYRVVQEVDEQIAETKAAIASEARNPVREETTARNIDYGWAQSELNKARVESAALQARASASRGLVSTYREKVRMLGRSAIEQQRLLRTARAAEETYLLYQKKREEARIGDALDERGIVNVAMIEEPRTPALPRRSPIAVCFVGLLAAVVSSAGLCFAADYADPTFRNPAEVADLLGIPVLATLPSADRALRAGEMQS